MSTRFTAEPGTVVTLRATFTQGGILFDPSAVGPVVIKDPAGAIIETIPVGSIVRDSIGRYHVVYTVATTAALGLWSDTWSYVEDSGGATVSVQLTFGVSAGCPVTPGDLWQPLASYASYLDPITTYTDAELQDAALLAQEIMESICGRRFVPTEESVDLDGNGRAYLYMDEDRHVLSVSSINEITYSGATSVLTPKDISQLKVYGSYIVLGDWQPHGDFGPEYCPPNPCVGESGFFTRGRKNIRVTGMFGDYATVPRRALRAAGLIAAMVIEDEFFPEAYSQESLAGDHSGTMREGIVGAVIQALPGRGDISVLLASLRRRSPVMSVI